MCDLTGAHNVEGHQEGAVTRRVLHEDTIQKAWEQLLQSQFAFCDELKALSLDLYGGNIYCQWCSRIDKRNRCHIKTDDLEILFRMDSDIL